MRQKMVLGVITLVMVVLCGNVCISQQAKGRLDLSKTAVVLPFESSVENGGDLPEATRVAIIQMLKSEAIFAAVLTPEEAKDRDRSDIIEIRAKLDAFATGSMATRLLVGLGAGRAHAGFSFTVKDASGNLLWQKKIDEKASLFSNAETSASQREQLPEKIAKSFVKEIKTTH